MSETTQWILALGVPVLGTVALVLYAVLLPRVKATERQLFAIMKELTERVDALTAKVPESRLQEVEMTISAFKNRIDAFVVENSSFREAVHKSIQRMDQIMRRNERAVIQSAERSLQDDGENGTPDEIPFDQAQPQTPAARRPSKAELRELLRRKLENRSQ